MEIGKNDGTAGRRQIQSIPEATGCCYDMDSSRDHPGGYRFGLAAEAFEERQVQAVPGVREALSPVEA